MKSESSSDGFRPNRMRVLPIPVLLPLVAVAVFVLCSMAKGDERALREDIKKYDGCLLRAVYSFSEPESRPPTTEAELKARCRTQAEAFKCLKAQTRNARPLIRRGLVTVANTRQRAHKRVCLNTASPAARAFVAGSKCILDAKEQEMVANDRRIWLTYGELIRRNYNDSAIELRQICCELFAYKQRFLQIAETSCATHKPMFGDLLSAMVLEDTAFVCDDDERLTKACAQVKLLEIGPGVKLGDAGPSSQGST